MDVSEYIDEIGILGKRRLKSHYETCECKCCKTGAFQDVKNRNDGCKVSSINLLIRVKHDKTKTKGGNKNE